MTIAAEVEVSPIELELDPSLPKKSLGDRMSSGALSFVPVIARRLVLMIPMLFGIVTITFLLTHAAAGDPAKLLAGQFATKGSIALINKEYGFNLPLVTQYWHYLDGIFHGNLGVSTVTHDSVVHDLWVRIPSTLELVVLILFVALAIGIPLGAYAGSTKRKSSQMVIRVITFVLLATPDFWLALVAIFFFYFKLTLLPGPTGQFAIGVLPPRTITGAHLLDSLLEGNWSLFSQAFSHVILPVMVVGLVLSAPLARLMRSSTIAVMESDSIKFSRAMGLGRVRIWRLAVRAALPSTVTFAGTVFTLLIGGLVLIETIFSWGGAAAYAATAIQNEDFDATQGFVLFCGFAAVIVFLVTDLIQMGIDPRIRAAGAGGRRRRPLSSLFRRASADHAAGAPAIIERPSRRPLLEPVRDTVLAVVELIRDINFGRAPASLSRFVRSRNYLMFSGIGVVLALVVGSYVIPDVSGWGAYDSNPAASFERPSLQHIFGTDAVGFDVFTRVALAARLDLRVAAEGVLISAVVGVLLGVVIGFSRRQIVDDIAMRIVDMIQAFPLLIAAVVIVEFAGNHLINVIGAIAFINVPIFLRLTRSQVLSIREQRYIQAATSIGNSRARTVIRHVIPNATGPVIVQVGASLGYAILTIAALAFLGVGIEAPQAEWGSMILSGSQRIVTGQWWTVVFPGLALLVAVIGFNLFAEGVERARDIHK
jgi:peptide/nickel transport system permease protein